MKTLVFLGLALASCYSNATLVVIEPDDFESGTDLSEVSPYVTLSTVSGDPVFSSTIHHRGWLAADGNDTSILGGKVFSRSEASNSEWYYWPARHNGSGGADGWSDVQNALMLTFSQPVDYFSLVFAELFPDAGCCVDDPILIDMFGPEGELIESRWGDSGPAGTYLGEAEDYYGETYDAWPVWEFSSFVEGVSTIIVGGESEPTTIDRLTFNVKRQVPEPSSLALMFSSLLLLLFVRRKISM